VPFRLSGIHPALYLLSFSLGRRVCRLASKIIGPPVLLTSYS